MQFFFCFFAGVVKVTGSQRLFLSSAGLVSVQKRTRACKNRCILHQQNAFNLTLSDSDGGAQ